jgi:hypothetical protein
VFGLTISDGAIANIQARADAPLLAPKGLLRNKRIELSLGSGVIVMAGLGPAMHVFVDCIKGKSWIAGLRRP